MDKLAIDWRSEFNIILAYLFKLLLDKKFGVHCHKFFINILVGLENQIPEEITTLAQLQTFVPFSTN